MFIEPMLLATAPAPFSDSRFIFEPKIDGNRLIFSQQNGVVRLSRAITTTVLANILR